MVIWSIWEEISRVMAILCLVTAGAAFVAAGILLVREELTGRLLETLKTETGRRKGILVLAAAGVWILVIGHGVSAAEVPQAERTASTAAGSLAGTSAAGSKVEAAAGETKAGAAGAKAQADAGEAEAGAAGAAAQADAGEVEAGAAGVTAPDAASEAETSAASEKEVTAEGETEASAASRTAPAAGEAEALAGSGTQDAATAASEEMAPTPASEAGESSTSETAEEREPGTGDKEVQEVRPDEKAPLVSILMTEETNEDEEGLIYCRQDNAGICVHLADDREEDTGVVSYEIVIEDSDGREIRRESGETGQEGTETDSERTETGPEGTETDLEPPAGETSLRIEIGTEEIALLADGPILVTARAADAAGNEGESRLTFVLDTEAPVLTQICTFACKGDQETEVPARTVYDGTDLYYCDERQVTRVKIEDDNPVFWRMRYSFLPGQEENNSGSIVSRQIEGQGAEGAASISQEGIYSDLIISGEDLAGNKLTVSPECRCTQDTEDFAQTEEGIALAGRKILDRTAPLGEICYRSGAKGFLYREGSTPDQNGTTTAVYFGGDVEVSLSVSDRCGEAEMPFDPRQFRLIRMENGAGLPCENGEFLVCEDGAVQFGAFGRDRAGNALAVREAFESPVEPVRSNGNDTQDGSERPGSGGGETSAISERQQQADEESCSCGPVIVRDTICPVAGADVSRPAGNPAGIDEENAIIYYGGDPQQYEDGEPVIEVSLRVHDLNADPDRIEMRTAYAAVPNGMSCEDVRPEWSDAVREECEVKREGTGAELPGDILMILRKYPGQEAAPDGVYRFGIAGTDKAGNPLVLAGSKWPDAEQGRQTVGGRNGEANLQDEAEDGAETGDELLGFVCVNEEEGAFMTGRKVIDTQAPRGEISIANGEGEVYCRMTAHGGGWTSERDRFMPYRRETEAVIRYSASDLSPVSASCRLLSTAGEGNEAAPRAERYLSECEGKILIRGGQIFRLEEWMFRDRAGNVSAALKRTVDFYLDTELPEADIDAPKAVVRAVPQITSQSADGRGLYSGAVRLVIMAEDPDREHGGSGLKEVLCSVKNNGRIVMENVVFEGEEAPAEPTDEHAPDPVYRYSSEITVPSGGEWESSDIEVTVIAEDNAGNRSDPGRGGTFRMGIDTTKPQVTVTYDNNEVRNGRYFGKPRKALIEVRERNFAKEKLLVTAPGAISGEWQKQEGADLWTMEVSFAADGEYTLEVSGSDALGNGAAVTYSGEAPQAFTIDRIPPLIEVIWDNEDVRNGMYYNKPRCATVRITELSLDEHAVQILPFSRALQRVSLVRDERTTGSVSVYEAEVPFDGEGEWSLRCACMDLAGNAAVPVYEEPFIIDMTAPRLYFDADSVREMGAYGSGISPALRCEDQNIAPRSLYAVWNNLTAGGCVMECRSGSIPDGAGEVILQDPPEERAADGICMLYGTACDLAGNRSCVRRNLCVNRFGSLYDISEDAGTMEIVNDYYTDASNPFVIAEYNVSAVKSRQITLYRNSGARVLEEGADYLVTQEQSPAGMKYTYAVDPSAYREEGKYSILIESEDEAGNISRSPGRFRAGTEFSPTWAVDRTPPQVRIARENVDGRKFVADSVELRLAPSDNMELRCLDILVTDDKDRLIEKLTIEGKELRETMDRNGGEVPVTIRADARWQTLRAVATDGAGNRSSGIQGIGGNGSAESCRVLVTSNLIVHLYRSGILPAIAFLALLSAFRYAYGVYKHALA